MKVLALEQPVSGVRDEQFTMGLLRAEAAAAWEMYRSGVLREMYFSADTHEAVLMLECADTEDAGRQLSLLPLVRAGLIAFRVIPLEPYSGFARLFGAASPEV